MPRSAYIEGVIAAALGKLGKASVDPQVVDCFSVNVGTDHHVTIKKNLHNGFRGLDDSLQNYCSLVAVGRAYLRKLGRGAAESKALDEEFHRLEQVCLRGVRATAAHRSHSQDRDARRRARDLAAKRWETNDSLRVSEVGREVADVLGQENWTNRSGEPYKEMTVIRWIRPLVPQTPRTRH